MIQVDVCFGPADFAGLPGRDLRDAQCVVFDVLRATSTIVTALANGARAVRPVASIEEALAERRRDPSILLAGERGGLRIGSELTGGVDFDFGNSPREFTPERVQGRYLAMTTTNGTLALRAGAGAGRVVAGAFLNLGATVDDALAAGRSRVILVCSGTGDDPALEDILAAGAWIERFDRRTRGRWEMSDSAEVALGAWRSARDGFPAGLQRARNARRLLARPELAEDVAVCGELDRLTCVPVMRDGRELVPESIVPSGSK